MVLALGTDISGGTDDDETHTTVFQTYLDDRSRETMVNGEAVSKFPFADEFSERAVFSDSVGNSYHVVSSSPIMFHRAEQRSMTEKYKKTKGDYVSAWLNHGIKPQGEQYCYLVIPADSGKAIMDVAKSPNSFYSIISKDDGLHVVNFPQQNITGYAFYKGKGQKTGEKQVVKEVSMPATVMTKQDGDSLVLAASVPDLGYDIEAEVNSLSNMKVCYFDEAKNHILSVTLRGKWSVNANDCKVRHNDETTVLMFKCKDGLGEKVKLEKL